jgi:hypothetical protein
MGTSAWSALSSVVQVPLPARRVPMPAGFKLPLFAAILCAAIAVTVPVLLVVADRRRNSAESSVKPIDGTSEYADN